MFLFDVGSYKLKTNKQKQYSHNKQIESHIITGWECTVHVTNCPICIVDKSLSVVITVRTVRILLLIFYCFGLKLLGKNGSFIYVFLGGHLWRRLYVVFWALNLFFHLQVTGIGNKITSLVNKKSTDSAF